MQSRLDVCGALNLNQISEEFEKTDVSDISSIEHSDSSIALEMGSVVSDVSLLSHYHESLEERTQQQRTPPSHFNSGFKLVFDNIDMNVKPRFMRSDRQTKSLHYVICYAMKDRIDFSNLSPELPRNPNLYEALPSEDDYQSLKNMFSILVAQLLVEH